MVKERLNLESEVQEIFKSIDEGRNFLLSGGAGSGKTYSLVSVIRQVIAENPTATLACMTYTNAAVKEIEERVNHKNLVVSTIHDFIWDNIKHFQKELKNAVISLANNPDITGISIDETDPIRDDYFDSQENGIQYKEYVKIRDGIISHDEILLVANFIFEEYPKLSTIVKDKYQFIFIDEYQDTNSTVIEILLKHFDKSSRKNIIGFFGDSMQSIYDDGVGNLNDYKSGIASSINEIKKEQNRRNPRKVIELANKLRTDGIIQVASLDKNAPNMSNGLLKEGSVTFFHSSTNDINIAKRYLTDNCGWDFSNPKETKELNLTHNLIADKAGFRNLMDIYDKDLVIGLKAAILDKIRDNKKKGKVAIEILEGDTFDKVVDKFQLKNRERNLKKDVILSDLVNASLYNQLKDKPFEEVKKIYLNKEALIDDKKHDENAENKKGTKRDGLIKHLFKIQNNISLYRNRKFNEFLRATDFRLKIINIQSKRDLKANIDALVNVKDKTIADVIKDADDKGICLIDDKIIDFINKNSYLYSRVKDIKFAEFQNLFNFLEGYTPFSTQHKTKGSEFDNVLVSLDNGGWTKYNFENLFLEKGKPSVLERTQKIFYVCCTRAKENLAILYHNPSEEVIDKASMWFGKDNVIEL